MKKLHPAFYLLAAAAIIYLGLIVLTPPDTDIITRSNITASQYRMLLVVVALPIIAIWLAATYGYAKISEYTKLINNSKDGLAMRLISVGIGILTIGLIVTSIIARVLSTVSATNEALLPAATVARSYITLIFYMAGFIVIYKGVQKLGVIARKKKNTNREWLVWLLFVAAGVLFIYLSLESPAGETLASAGNSAVYHLPVWLVVSTVIIPYLVTWAIGIRAAYILNLYKKGVRGKLYQVFFGNLSLGLTMVVISSVLIQYFTALTVSIMELPLASLLAIVYLLLIALASGYVLIARGANKLKAIEET